MLFDLNLSMNISWHYNNIARRMPTWDYSNVNHLQTMPVFSNMDQQHRPASHMAPMMPAPMQTHRTMYQQQNSFPRHSNPMFHDMMNMNKGFYNKYEKYNNSNIVKTSNYLSWFHNFTFCIISPKSFPGTQTESHTHQLHHNTLQQNHLKPHSSTKNHPWLQFLTRISFQKRISCYSILKYSSPRKF